MSLPYRDFVDDTLPQRPEPQALNRRDWLAACALAAAGAPSAAVGDEPLLLVDGWVVRASDLRHPIASD